MQKIGTLESSVYIMIWVKDNLKGLYKQCELFGSINTDYGVFSLSFVIKSKNIEMSSFQVDFPVYNTLNIDMFI